MIVKKYTDENDNPQAQVLAQTGQRTWVGTETALDAAILAGTIPPGTVADTYVTDDQVTVDFATKEYVKLNNKLSGWETAQTSQSFTDPSGRFEHAGTTWQAEYDGFISFGYSFTAGTASIAFHIQNEINGTWTNVSSVVMGDGTSPAMSLMIPVNKGSKYRSYLIKNGSNSTTISLIYNVDYYKDRDYSE